MKYFIAYFSKPSDPPFIKQANKCKVLQDLRFFETQEISKYTNICKRVCHCQLAAWQCVPDAISFNLPDCVN
jgi:hypothetical protein